MEFALENVKTFLEKDLTNELKNVRAELFKQIKLPLVLGKGKLCDLLTIAKTVRRDISVERDAPDHVSNFMALR